MKISVIIISFIVFVFGCKQSFSQESETALALPNGDYILPSSIVFIAGFDQGENSYYMNAKSYFESKHMKIIDNLFSVDEIVTWLNKNSNTTYEEIHIVSHSNPWLGMSLKTTKNGERISVKALQEASLSNKIQLLESGTDGTTKIIFHSCGLGENKTLLKELKKIFTIERQPKVYASGLFNIFGGKFAGHYLATPYYGFYPTAESPGPAQLSKEFAAAYPKTDIGWFTALKTRKETTPGTPYSYKFNIPLEWEFTFDAVADIPEFEDRDAIMDWVSDAQEVIEVLLEFNIPIEKYRWKSKIRGNTLIIKGKTTVLCVLAPLLQDIDSNEYCKPILTDASMYQIL